MIGFLSAFDEAEVIASKEKISIIHIESESDDDVFKEVSPMALAFSRYFELKKVYLFYGKDKKIIYDYSL